MSVKIGEYVGFCVYHRSYLLWPPVMSIHVINSDTLYAASCRTYIPYMSRTKSDAEDFREYVCLHSQ